MSETESFKGTTTVGIVCKDGVILGSDTQAIYYYIASKNVRKILKIDDMIGVTISGTLGDPQALLRVIKAEATLYKFRREESISVKGITTLLARILNEQRFFPYLTILIVGGVDRRGPQMFTLDPLGGQIEEKKFASTGSGSIVAYGVLEDRYRENMSIDEGIDLTIRALHNALKRDSGSGGGIDIVKITPEGYVKLEESEVKKRRDKLP
jgi:proteasome beta subunit